MPIYDQSYRSHTARGPLHRVRFWPITREGLRLLLAKRALLLLGMLAWLPFVVFVGILFVAARFPEAGSLLALDGTLFGQFLSWQTGFVLLLTIFGGAGLIAEDQPLRIEIGLVLEPGLPPTRNVRPLLLAGVRGFF